MNDKIDLFTCKFQDRELELKYQEAKWKDVSSFYYNINIFFLFIGLTYLLSLYLRNTIAIKTIISPLIQVIIPVFLLTRSENFRKLYMEKFILFLPVINMSLFHFLDFERLSNLSHIPMLPLFHSIVWTALFPFNFIYSIIASGVPFIGSLFILENFELSIPVIIVIYFCPFSMLLFNKWKAEFNARETFSKSLTINENRKLMHETLNRYFGDKLSEKIISNKGELKGENRWVTISFTDMNKYSTIIEKMSPEIAVQFLNEYFTSLHKVIKKYNGVILNYVGDSVMVIYGAPESQKDHEILALKTAIDMRDELKKLNERWNENKFSRYWKNVGINEVTCRTGLHCGNLIIGNMGSDDLLQYSAIGDVVNIASRLETINKEFSTEIAMSEEIYASLTDDFVDKVKLQGQLNLKGRSNSTNVYSI